MMSRPSAFTQRVYGVSFSVANFFARSSEARASLAMRYAPSRSSLNRAGSASIRPAGALSLRLRRPVRRDGDAFLRLHANVDRVAGRRPQRRMRPRLQHNIAHLDVEIQILAKEILGMNGGADDVLAGCALRLLLGEFNVLGTDRDDHRAVLGNAFGGLRLDLAHRRAHQAVSAALERGHGAADEIGSADETGDEPAVRRLINM